MTRSFRRFTTTRAPRVNLRGSVSATILLENGRQISGKLHQLSITGGLLELATYIDERVKVSLGFAIGSGTLYPKAEMLFPMRGGVGYLQPFRFSRLWPEERQILELEIAELLKQTVARSKIGRGLGMRLPGFYSDLL